MGVKTVITPSFSHNYARNKVNSYDFLFLEKTLAFHNVIIHINSVANKDQYHYYYNTFLEKCSDELAKQQ